MSTASHDSARSETARPLLTIDAVHKRFGDVTAVDDISFQVRPGEIFALLGPNGAGKTTLIRMLVELIRPDRGSIRYARGGLTSDGSGPPRDAARSTSSDDTAPAASVSSVPRDQIGYLPEERGLYQDVGVLKTLVYFGTLRGMTGQGATEAAERWLSRMSLADRSGEKLKALSKGNQQKVQFVSSILHRPRFAVLDEPFSGLDPLNQDLFLGLIRELRADGTTVILSAHQMQLVERVADRILVLREGRAVLHGTLPEVRRRWATGTRLILRLAREPSPDALRRLDTMATVERADGGLELFVAEGRPLGPALAAAGEALEIVEIESHPVTLHDVYLDAVGGSAEIQAISGEEEAQ